MKLVRGKTGLLQRIPWLGAIYWEYDSAQGYDVQREYACSNCHGQGRILTKVVQKAEMPPTEVA
jgi:hypothetical protein